jgi:uncharacterized protein YbjT (DUF2867 family)
MMYLVVGASGHLGSTVVGLLRHRAVPTRVLLRDRQRLASTPDLQVAIGDLRDVASLDRALAGVHTVIATATAMTPRRGDSIADIDDQGYANLLAAAQRHQVARFVYTSVPASGLDQAVPILRAKRKTERRLLDSGLEPSILRFPPFMEISLAMTGCAFVLDGESNSLVTHPYRLPRLVARMAGNRATDRGQLLVNGDANLRQAFIAVPDVARLLLAAADHPNPLGIVECGGPEIMTWNDVAGILTDLLHRPVTTRSTPIAVFRLLQTLLRPVAPAVANIMGLNRLSGVETPWPPPTFAVGTAAAPSTTVRRLVADKLAPRHPSP